MNIPKNVDVKHHSNLSEAVEAAQKFAFGNHAFHFEGTIFEQGGRPMFSTAMAFEMFCRVAEAKSAEVTPQRNNDGEIVAVVGDDVDAVAETTNRPIDRGHVKGITKYLMDAITRKEKYIMPPATLNLRGDMAATLFTVDGPATTKPAILVLPPHARFEITDAQHRCAGIDAALRNPASRRQLLRDGIGAMITFENDPNQVHQDFADASKTRAIAGSLVAVYDGRLPVNAIAIHLARNCRLFKHTIDATTSGSSLSAGSVKVWNTNVLRQLVKYSGLNSRAGDEAWNKAFVSNYGESGSDAYERFRQYLVMFVDECSIYIPLFKKLASLKADDLSEVPRIRAQGGGQILMTAPGMNVLGAIGYMLYQRHKSGKDITGFVKSLGEIDWSYNGALWKGSLLVEAIAKPRGGTPQKVMRVSPSAVAVNAAVEKVRQAIGLGVTDMAA